MDAKRSAKPVLIAAITAIPWGFLLFQNLERYFVFGWGHTLLIDLVGLVPLLGIIAAIVVFWFFQAHRARAGAWLAVTSIAFAVLYFLAVESPTAIDVVRH